MSYPVEAPPPEEQRENEVENEERRQRQRTHKRFILGINLTQILFCLQITSWIVLACTQPETWFNIFAAIVCTMALMAWVVTFPCMLAAQQADHDAVHEEEDNIE